MSVAAPPVLHAETSDVRPLARQLRGIGLKHNAVLQVSKAGFEVIVEEGHTLSATAFIPQTLFRVFTYTPGPAESSTPEPEDEEEALLAHMFEVSIDAFLQCLNIFGDAGPLANSGNVTFGGNRKREWAGEVDRFGDPEADGGEPRQKLRSNRGDRATSLSMDWQGPGAPLVLLLLQDPQGPVTRCELKTLEPESLNVDEFDQDNLAMQVIMKSSWFREALLDLPPSSTKLTLIGSPMSANDDDSQVFGDPSRSRKSRKASKAGMFKLRAVGTFGYTELDYPNDASVIERFECTGPVSYGYNAAHFALLARALQHSPKVSIRIETSGFLSVQCLMPDPEGMPKPAPGENSGIIEFKMQALEDDDESD